MSGPVVAALGPFAFQAHGFGLTDISRNTSTKWANVAVSGGMDRLQWTGGDNDEVTISGVLFPHEFGGMGALSGIRAAAEAGQPLMLVNLAGQIFGLHVVESISEDRSLLDRNGLPMRNAYKLSMKRFQGAVPSLQSVLVGLFS